MECAPRMARRVTRDPISPQSLQWRCLLRTHVVVAILHQKGDPVAVNGTPTRLPDEPVLCLCHISQQLSVCESPARRRVHDSRRLLVMARDCLKHRKPGERRRHSHCGGETKRRAQLSGDKSPTAEEECRSLSYAEHTSEREGRRENGVPPRARNRLIGSEAGQAGLRRCSVPGEGARNKTESTRSECLAP
jgi:hypothetical protein